MSSKAYRVLAVVLTVVLVAFVLLIVLVYVLTNTLEPANDSLRSAVGRGTG